MDSFLRALAVYGFLLLFFRLSGKRSLAQVTVFDFIMLLIIGEATQQALLGNDFSLTNSLLVVLTLLFVDITLSWVSLRVEWLEQLMEGMPTLIVDNGRPLTKRMKRSRIREVDILAAARRLQGLERMDQIKYAVLEQDGTISIIPVSPNG